MAILNLMRALPFKIGKQYYKMSSYIKQYEPNKESSPTFGEKQPKHIAEGGECALLYILI